MHIDGSSGSKVTCARATARILYPSDDISVDCLNNWRKHREDRTRAARSWNVDPYSTGALFGGWKGREEATTMWRWPETYEPLVVYLPSTWLLREGWLKHGRVGFREVPSAAALP